ncbi:MAG: hypothetical protein KA164_18475 [Rhodoferax sp.]|jgi:hypothetical protein|nr:hypothetical protein [Rhodoferax sp.]
MRQQVIVYWSEGVDFNLHADPSAPMSPDQAWAWLDEQFTAMECEPLRALGKVLTADKVLRVTEAAGPGRLRDEQWAAAYARAVSGAIGKPMIRVDVPSMTLTY